MTALRAIIVDDEALARERVRTLLAEFPDITVIAECTGGRAAIEAIEEHTPDLVFLDIQMPDLDGFEVLAALAPHRLPAVVFVTAYDEYALKAFDVHALDYLLKPIEPERFAAAVRRVIDMVCEHRGDQRLLALLETLGAREPRLDRLVVRQEGKVLLVRPEDVDWVEADGKYTRLHTGGKAYRVRQPLKDVAEQLRSRGFVRIHRSTVINIDRVKELEPWFHGEYVVILRDGTKLHTSAAYSDELHRLLAKPL